MRHFLIILATVLSITSFCQVTSITNGLVAEYTFNNGTADADFGGVNGNAVNVATTYDRYGCPGRALQFDMLQESLIDLGDSFDNVTAGVDNEWSFSCWFKLDSMNNPYAPMMNKYSHNACGVDHRQFILRMSANNEVEFTYHTSPQWTSFVIVRAPTPIVDREWHHVVINYDGSQDGNNGHDRVEMWIDNVLQATTLANYSGAMDDIVGGDAHLGIGARLNENGNYCPITGQDHLWDGALDDFRIFDRLLTPAEVDTLFNEPAIVCSADIPVYEGSINITMFPNPAQDFLSVQINHPGGVTNIEVSVIDMNGKIVLREVVTNTNFELDITSLAPAAYTVEFIDAANEHTEIRKFIKK